MWTLFHVIAVLGLVDLPLVTSVQLHLSRIFSHSRKDNIDQNVDVQIENQVQDNNLNSITDEHPELYPRSTTLNPPDKVVPLEHLAQKAYGEPGEKWKVLGYSETTGYPIMDLSELGIDTSPKPYVPAVSNKKPSKKNDEKKPMSYSEMKGGAGLKQQNAKISNTLSTPSTEKRNPKSSNYYKIKKTLKPGKKQNYKADRVVQKLHMQLHRTQRHETVRSILYPKSKPPKYRISTETKKLTRFLRFGKKPESKGKYDIRYLDVEKLMDIIVPDAVVLVYKYIRDLPSVPLIYECKIGILFPFMKIMGGFQQLDDGKTFTTKENVRRRDLIRGIFRMFIRWLLGITPRRSTIEGVARNVEHDITMFALDLPGWTDKECEGEMDEQDWDNFNFHYNFMIENMQLKEKREEKNKSLRSEIKNIRKSYKNK